MLPLALVMNSPMIGSLHAMHIFMNFWKTRKKDLFETGFRTARLLELLNFLALFKERERERERDI